MRFRRIVSCLLLAALFQTLVAPAVVVAQETTDAETGSLKREIDALNTQIKEKEQRTKELDAVIGGYRKKITEHEGAIATLQNQVELLENRIEEKVLAIERTKNEIDLANLELLTLSSKIKIEESTITRREADLAELIQQINQADRVQILDAFMSRPSLSEFFARVDQMKRVEGELADATHDVKDSRDRMVKQKKEVETRRATLQEKRQSLAKEGQALAEDRAAKVSIIAETQDKEGEFQRILYELRQEQQSDADEVARLRDKLKESLDSIDTSLARGDILLSWPIRASRISAHFHDATYPFRKLFEHPGTDLPTPVGTPVRAAAGGYVAWTRTGTQYGNYIMIIHPNGIATVYAHLSRFGVKGDAFVERGDVIGYSGGQPGMQGAGLSTGPHLHFEVRQNGIPVNAENYLPSFD